MRIVISKWKQYGGYKIVFLSGFQIDFREVSCLSTALPASTRQS